ncbi:MAG: zinc-binding dehydrogenase, partial [Pseudomonadota bacterium]
RHDPAHGDPSLSLGILGINGITAYHALLDVGAPQPGQTVVVSTAAGGVGSAVGQIAGIKGCRTVGIAGGADKVAACTGEFGYDAAIDYKAGDVAAALDAACPDGIDVYFDNTSGPISDAVAPRLFAHFDGVRHGVVRRPEFRLDLGDLQAGAGRPRGR